MLVEIAVEAFEVGRLENFEVQLTSKVSRNNWLPPSRGFASYEVSRGWGNSGGEGGANRRGKDFTSEPPFVFPPSSSATCAGFGLRVIRINP